MGKKLQDGAKGGHYVRKAAPSMAQGRALGAFVLLQIAGAAPDRVKRDPQAAADLPKATSFLLAADAVGISRCRRCAWDNHDARGEASRIDEVILNPFLGPRLNAGTVTTDLPMGQDLPIDFGLQSFCESCNRCARECPGGAITVGPKPMFNGYEIRKSGIQKCATCRAMTPGGAMCGRCIFISRPINHFAFVPDAAKTLLTGGGIGITPMVAMAHEMHRAGRDFACTILGATVRR